MLDALSSPQRVLDALERALSDTPPRDLPDLAVQGALSADSAALLIGENGKLVIRATAGLEIPPDAADPRSVAGRALADGSVVEASDTENARAVLAFPLQFGDELLGVLRVSSRTAWKFSDDEKRFLRAIATRAATLLAGDDPQARLGPTLRTFESLIEASPLPILSIDRNGSSRSGAALRRSSSAGSATRWWERRPPWDRTTWRRRSASVRRSTTGGSSTIRRCAGSARTARTSTWRSPPLRCGTRPAQCRIGRPPGRHQRPPAARGTGGGGGAGSGAFWRAPDRRAAG